MRGWKTVQFKFHFKLWFEVWFWDFNNFLFGDNYKCIFHFIQKCLSQQEMTFFTSHWEVMYFLYFQSKKRVRENWWMRSDFNHHVLNYPNIFWATLYINMTQTKHYIKICIWSKTINPFRIHPFIYRLEILLFLSILKLDIQNHTLPCSNDKVCLLCN